jgi:hypothetical protein
MECVFVDDFINIFEMDLSEAEKIAHSFNHVTSIYIASSEQEIELLKAMRDKETLIKEQIKMETMKHVRSIFKDCYMRSTGKEAWND